MPAINDGASAGGANASPLGGRPTATRVEAGIDENRLFAKVTWRIVPLLCLSYVLAFIDRVNIGYAQLQMKADLSFSDAVYGFGAGIFFLGYFLFEVPSNLMLARIGARTTLLRIMVGWGLVSAATMLVSTPMQFYTARFLLGAFEAGLFPGVIFYLSAWLPAKRRAQSVALFMTATVVSGLIGGPLSGWIMTGLDGVNGWRGWHWLFLTEGVPSSLYGVLLYLCLPDRPSEAKWLSAKESAFLAEMTAAEQRATAAVSGNQSFLQSFASPKLYVLSAASFMTLCSVYAVSFWMPLMIKATGVENPFHIGLYAMIPNAVTLAAMMIIGRHSDRTLERRWHYALATLAGAGGLALTTLGTDSLPLALVGLAIAQAGVITALPLFWAVATSVLPRNSAAGALAVINSVGNLGGFFAPSIIGFVKTATGSLSYGLRITAAITALAGVTMLLGISKRALDAVRASGSGERFS